MSTRLHEYPFLKQSFVQHHSRRPQTKSPENTSSDVSVIMGSEKTMVTPPTPCYDDDEGSAFTAFCKSLSLFHTCVVQHAALLSEC